MLSFLERMAPVLENHLWQSTAFAAGAWLFALALRKNQARARYWLWLAASLKFLAPFSLLFAIGGYLRPARVAIVAPASVSIAVQQIAQPFSDLGAVNIFVTPADARHSNIPLVLLVIWMVGVFGIAFSWWRKWRRVCRACTAAQLSFVHSGVPVKSSPSLFEPGVFGIFRPVLMLPAGIADRLTPKQMDAILAHEMGHVRRRDNLTAALHMFVECVFWFHPLVWWIGARMVEERERACDEEVLARGGEAETYAESIIEVCKFYAESPVACVSGVSGADLKKRIVRIMSGQFAAKLTLGGKLLLGVVAVAAVAVPLAFGAITAPQVVFGRRVRMLYLRQGGPAYGGDSLHLDAEENDGKSLPSFEVASIKPGDPSGGRGFGSPDPSRFRVINMTAKGMVQFVYGLKEFQLTGGPDWANSKIYSVDAKVEDSVAKRMQGMSRPERQQQERMMLHSLLIDRFKLQVSHVTKDEPEYALVVAKGGPKLTPTTWVAPPPNSPGGQALPGKGPHLLLNNGDISAVNQPVSGLADLLAFMPEIEGHLVVDHTGITGNYDYEVKFSSAALDQKFAHQAGVAPPATSDDSGPSIFTALEEQLGLKLEMTRGPVEIYTIEHIEEPSEN